MRVHQYLSFILLCIFIALCVSGSYQTFKFPVNSRPKDALMQDFHHTRYYGGCFEGMTNKSYGFNKIAPFILNFDLVLTGCQVNWDNPAYSRIEKTCVFEFTNHPLERHHLLRVHVHSDLHHHKFFINRVLPAIERTTGGRGIILHSGTGDSSIDASMASSILKQSSIKRWVLEQATVPALENHLRVLHLPVGICAREVTGHRGRDLRTAVAESRRTPWLQRKDRILVCFGANGHRSRVRLLDIFSTGACTVCDICPGPLPALDLWRLYGQYRYVLSPWGSGKDCGRSWEILLMGAVPVIEHFVGVVGYERAGLSVVSFHHPSELNATSLHSWNRRPTPQRNDTLLSYAFWKERMFDETPLLTT